MTLLYYGNFGISILGIKEKMEIYLIVTQQYLSTTKHLYIAQPYWD